MDFPSMQSRIVRLALACAAAAPAAWSQAPERFARFQAGERVAYGLVEGAEVREIEGDLFSEWKRTERVHALADVKLLVPVERPMQVFAMAGNYKSHLGVGDVVTTVTTTTRIVSSLDAKETRSDSRTTVETERPGEIPTKFQTPQAFLKPTGCLIADGAPIVLPAGSKDVHYEAELVIVIGRRARNVPKEAALDYVFGATCGNDVSARDWQKGDVQWWRAKGSETFGPCGPWIATGLNYDDLRVRGRLNGEVVQDERTSELIHGVREMVSFLSEHVTLYPGDLIYAGTSGRTKALKAGDVFEVEIEGVGTLKNPVVSGP